MADELRVVDLEKWTECTAARVIIGVMPAVNELLMQEKLPLMILLFRLYKHSVGWGYHVDPERYVNLDYCKRIGCELARSHLGWGTVFYDAGTNGVFLICPADFCQRHGIFTLEDGYKAWGASIAEGLSEKFGIDARYRPLNDVYVWRPEFPKGRKLLGSAGFFRGPCVIQGFCQVEIPDLEAMEKSLKPPPEKFADKGAEVSVVAKATSLEGEIGRKPSYAEWADAIKTGFAKRLNVDLVPWEWIPWEEPKELWEIAKRYHDKMWNDEYRYVKTEARRFGIIPEDVTRTRFANKIPGGPLFDIIMLSKEGVIKDVSITGSIHVIPADCTEKMEQALKGISLSDEGAIRARIDQVAAETNAVIGMATINDLEEAIIGAARK